MVVKTEVCNFCEYKIYPGKGIRIITRDGRLTILATHKAQQSYLRKTKGQALRWTVVWRRLNKKMKTDKTHRRKKRKAQKVVKGIAGMDTEEIRRRQNESEQERLAQREKIIREIKERKRQDAQKKKKTNKKKN